ncbi:hypothetical protein [Galbitalea soli]|uniref:Uncharacterized protein n=1 Tax=Galbitalea soli TaxID=1268042 RepID=A0A7C9PMI3_9MICO|nr:hypothetical protein [Galbitalea soli]NEM90905.1 hypothetical protein [Galbitalea soli]NYJ31629.1 hypothetical protein [Galbitalea soli]
MPDADLEAKVLDDLKMLRKFSNGVTVHTLAEASTICRLLGEGDPYVAYTRLQHALLDATSDRTVRAAAASLGLTSEGQSHLDRLEDAGAELGGIDQRQARRLSDRGLAVIAKLIATNWTVEAVPELTALVSTTPEVCQIIITTQKPSVIYMSEPEIELWVGSGRRSADTTWEYVDRGGTEIARPHLPLEVPNGGVETSATIVWRGELWPKYTVRWVDVAKGVASETLGNKLMLRFNFRQDD